jgi:hypothetical protein
MRLTAFTGIALILGIEREVEFTGYELIISPTESEDGPTARDMNVGDAMGIVDALEGKAISAATIAATPVPEASPPPGAPAPEPPKAAPEAQKAGPTPEAPQGGAKAASSSKAPKGGARGGKAQEGASTSPETAKASPAPEPAKPPPASEPPKDEGEDIPFGKDEAKAAPKEPEPAKPTSAPGPGDRDGDYVTSDTEVAKELTEAPTLRAVLSFLMDRGFTTSDQLVTECERLKATGKVPVLDRITEPLEGRVKRAIELMDR